MMTSNILSRFLPPNGNQSVYETIRQHDEDSESADIEERAGLVFDDHRQDFSDRELEDAMADAEADGMPGESDAFLPRQSSPPRHESRRRKPSRLRRRHGVSPRHDPDEGDDDVPASLLVEGQEDDEELRSRLPPPPAYTSPREREPPVPGPSSRDERVRWETARDRLPLHGNSQRPRPGVVWSFGRPNLARVDPKEKALYMWANVDNLDNFLNDVYTYYLGNGIWSIFLNRVLNLMTIAFVVAFFIFLTNCVDYHSVRGSKTLHDILIPQCTKKMSWSSNFFLWLLTFSWIGKLFQYMVDIRRLKNMHDFYHYLLGITDAEIQTISWQEIVSRLMTLRDSNPATARTVSAQHRKFMGSQSKQRMDAHDIANRLMRRENYFIALINKDILDLTLPIPFLKSRQLFSRTLEWNIYLCVMDYVFNEQGQVQALFLKDTHRKALSEGLRRRFIVAGILNIVISPFLVIYFMMHAFFRYFNEYHKNPSQIGSRQYTPLGEWKFREFNELWHLFNRRINMSYPVASRYIDQFPKDKTVQVAAFVAFVAGALASVLALASLIDPELFLGFEITHDRTVLFYLGVFGSIWAFTRGVVGEETEVFEPEYALLEVINYTHYCPSHWKDRFHSDDVRKEFATLYQMKIVIFLEEILSMIFTPFILWFSLPKCSDRIIDFFREFTVHVDGMGYLCSFAVFDFKKGTNVISQGEQGRRAPADPRADYFSTKDGKMLASYYGFLDHYGAKNNPSHRRQFHPPPAFPTLGSPSAIDLGMNNFNNDRLDQTQARHGFLGAPGAQSLFGHRPGQGPGPIGLGMGDHHASSPAPSILLDPHHQPSASGFRTAMRSSTTGLARPKRARIPTLAGPIEDDEEESPSPMAHSRSPGARRTPRHGTSSSGAGAGGAETGDGGSLGDSWRMNLMGEEEEEEGEQAEGDDVDAIAGGAGVLGLINQYHQVKKDNRGRTTVGL